MTLLVPSESSQGPVGEGELRIAGEACQGLFVEWKREPSWMSRMPIDTQMFSQFFDVRVEVDDGIQGLASCEKLPKYVDAEE